MDNLCLGHYIDSDYFDCTVLFCIFEVLVVLDVGIGRVSVHMCNVGYLKRYSLLSTYSAVGGV